MTISKHKGRLGHAMKSQAFLTRSQLCHLARFVDCLRQCGSSCASARRPGCFGACCVGQASALLLARIYNLTYHSFYTDAKGVEHAGASGEGEGEGGEGESAPVEVNSEAGRSKYFKYFPVGLESWRRRHRCCIPKSRRSAVIVEPPPRLTWGGYQKHAAMQRDVEPFLAYMEQHGGGCLHLRRCARRGGAARRGGTIGLGSNTWRCGGTPAATDRRRPTLTS